MTAVDDPNTGSKLRKVLTGLFSKLEISDINFALDTNNQFIICEPREANIHAIISELIDEASTGSVGVGRIDMDIPYHRLETTLLVRTKDSPAIDLEHELFYPQTLMNLLSAQAIQTVCVGRLSQDAPSKDRGSYYDSIFEPVTVQGCSSVLFQQMRTKTDQNVINFMHVSDEHFTFNRFLSRLLFTGVTGALAQHIAMSLTRHSVIKEIKRDYSTGNHFQSTFAYTGFGNCLIAVTGAWLLSVIAVALADGSNNDYDPWALQVGSLMVLCGPMFGFIGGVLIYC